MGVRPGLGHVLRVFGSALFRKAAAAQNESRLERSRREALEKLALAELQRAQSERLATVGRLAASVMHEINNPLAFVRSNLQFIQTEVSAQPLSPELRHELEEVFRETRLGMERIQQIIQDLKGFSHHMDAEAARGCVLAGVVEDAARLASIRTARRGERACAWSCPSTAPGRPGPRAESEVPPERVTYAR